MCGSPHLSRRHLLRVAGAAALGGPLLSALAQMPSVARASRDQALDYAAPMIATFATQRVALEPVDAADVTIVVDNAIDILAADTPVSTRTPLLYDWSEQPHQLRSEHGYSLVLTVQRNGQSDTILYDAGLGRDTAVNNMDLLGINPSDFRTMVLSHGHPDHHTGLEGLFSRIGQAGMPLILHPDAWRERKITFPSGVEIHMPPPSHQDLDREGWQVVEERAPSLLLNNSVLVTGQVDRVTDFEKGFPIQTARTSDGGWEPDPWVWDDQAVIVNVRDRGLVILSGCSHAGAINVLRYAQALTGQQNVHAFVGGMHLTGGLFEPIIPRTISELAAIGPDYVVPGHCTGWKAVNALISTLPDAYVQSNTGTSLHFAAPDVNAFGKPEVAT
jgi:7,8-dihydropterin-6-yl-methyl-4-(beta-D-ribofuranosyl)aminobenzene 5'-phosphate synthase